MVYNELRAKHHPVPSEYSSPNDSHTAESQNSIGNAETSIQNDENIDELANDLHVENAAAVTDNENKPALLPLQMDEDDVMAMNELFNEAAPGCSNTGNEYVPQSNDADASTQNNFTDEFDFIINSTQMTFETDIDEEKAAIPMVATEISNQSDQMNDSHKNVSSSHNSSQSSNTDEEIKVTEIVGDIEVTYCVGQKIMPQIVFVPMPIKTYDVLSGNIPYRGICDRDDVRLYLLTISFHYYIRSMKCIFF